MYVEDSVGAFSLPLCTGGTHDALGPSAHLPGTVTRSSWTCV
jgi:hypothetical protein